MKLQKKSQKRSLFILPLLLCAGLLCACGGKGREPLSEQDVEVFESIMESIAESVAESVAESMAESITGTPANPPAADTPSSAESTEASMTALTGTSAAESTEASIAASAPSSENASAKPSATQTTSSPSAPSAPYIPTGDAFAQQHGALRVDGAKLVDQNGNPIQLYGMSTHGLAWYPQFVSYDSFRTLRDDWNTNCVRLAMYTHEYGGYCSGGDQDYLKSLVRSGVDYATQLGMYVIIDWHILQEQDPNVYKDQSLAFFKEMSETYADYTNVLYEICNEPNGYATWESVKSYAEAVIPVIRANDPDAIIIVGTPTWSQDIDKAFANPIKEENILYALHFYAATHKDVLWNRLDSCAQNGLPVFVSEFGMCDASGGGGNDFNSASRWFEVIDKYNISFCCWNLGNKAETCCVIKPDCSKTSDWTEDDLTESGKWIRNHFRDR